MVRNTTQIAGGGVATNLNERPSQNGEKCFLCQIVRQGLVTTDSAQVSPNTCLMIGDQRGCIQGRIYIGGVQRLCAQYDYPKSPLITFPLLAIFIGRPLRLVKVVSKEIPKA